MTKVKERNQKAFKLNLIKRKLKQLQKIISQEHKEFKHPSTKYKSQKKQIIINQSVIYKINKKIQRIHNKKIF